MHHYSCCRLVRETFLPVSVSAGIQCVPGAFGDILEKTQPLDPEGEVKAAALLISQVMTELVISAAAFTSPSGLQRPGWLRTWADILPHDTP